MGSEKIFETGTVDISEVSLLVKEPLPDLGNHVSLNTLEALNEALLRLAGSLLHTLLQGPGCGPGQGGRGLLPRGNRTAMTSSWPEKIGGIIRKCDMRKLATGHLN